jgi:hypothetical protein
MAKSDAKSRQKACSLTPENPIRLYSKHKEKAPEKV